MHFGELAWSSFRVLLRRGLLRSILCDTCIRRIKAERGRRFRRALLCESVGGLALEGREGAMSTAHCVERCSVARGAAAGVGRAGPREWPCASFVGRGCECGCGGRYIDHCDSE